MRQRNVRYLTRMIVKTAIILLPILITFFAVFICKNVDGVETFSPMLSDLEDFCLHILGLPINAWYVGFMEIFGLDALTGYTLGAVIMCLPLYFIWVEIFDLLLHLIFFFTDLFHKFLGGDK